MTDLSKLTVRIEVRGARFDRLMISGAKLLIEALPERFAPKVARVALRCSRLRVRVNGGRWVRVGRVADKGEP